MSAYRESRWRGSSFGVLPSSFAEFVGQLACAGRSVTQLAASERQEYALEARLLDRQPANAVAKARKQGLGESLAARFEHELAVAANHAVRIGRCDLGRGGLVARNQPDELLAVGALELRRRILRQDAAVVDDADAVAALDLLDVMGRDNDGELALIAQPMHVLPEPLARLGIEPDRRLVEEQNARVVNERPRDLEPPFHSR